MKLKSINWAAIIITLLFISNLLILMKTTHYEFIVSNLVQKDSLLNKQINILETKEWMQMENGGIKLSDDIRIFNKESKEIYFKTLSSGKPKLICYFSDQNCDVCVISIINTLKEYIPIFGEDNVVVLASYLKKRDVKVLKKQYNIEFELYEIGKNELSIPLENYDTPFLFILDNDYCTKKIFVPEKTMPQLTGNYFHLIRSIFKK